jgi:hypothetical protein
MKKFRVIHIFFVVLVFLLIATSAVSARAIPEDGAYSQATEFSGVALSDGLRSDKLSESESCSCCNKTGTSMKSISLDDPVLESLKQTPEAALVKDNLGELLWNQATVQSQLIEDKPWQILTVPIVNTNTTEAQVLLAATEDRSQFRILVFGMQPEDLKIDKGQGFSGTLKFYSPDGNLLISAIYSDGKLQSTENGTSEISPTGLNWGCFGDCLLTMGYDLWIGCYSICSACSSIPVPYNPMCLACAGCYGVGAFVCIIACWE